MKLVIKDNEKLTIMRIIYIGLVLILLSSITIHAQKYGTGCLIDEAKYNQVKLTLPQTSRSFDDLPLAHSLKQFCPIPQNQGSQGSCTGWASSYAARTILDAVNASTNNEQEDINESAFSPSFTYNQVKLSTDCSEGAYIAEILEILKQKGALKLSEFPYECERTPNTEDYKKAHDFTIQDYKRLTSEFSTQEQVINDIKKALVNNRPLVIGMTCYASFETVKTVWNGVQEYDQQLGGHAMAVIGYDDNKHGGSFEIMNSWGTNWGDNGFFSVSYDDFYENVFEVHEIIPAAMVQESSNLKGSFKLVKSNGKEMKAKLSTTASRDFNIVASKNSTYKLKKSYRSGERFRIYFTNEQPAYVYIIGYGTRTKKVSGLFPFDEYSANLGYDFSEVAIPNEEYFIQLDDNVGTDYLCILYSKESLDLSKLVKEMQALKLPFTSRVKKVLKNKLYQASDIKFETDKVAFQGESKGKSVIPIIVEFNHIE